jgi:hypothetical protein
MAADWRIAEFIDDKADRFPECRTAERLKVFTKFVVVVVVVVVVVIRSCDVCQRPGRPGKPYL